MDAHQEFLEAQRRVDEANEALRKAQEKDEQRKQAPPEGEGAEDGTPSEIMNAWIRGRAA